MDLDYKTLGLVGGVLGLLAGATAVNQVLKRQGGEIGLNPAVLVARNEYDIFTVLIPVYAFLFIPARVALAGDFKRFLERTAKIQSGLIICVYCLSHAPALLSLKIPGGHNALLLFFFVLVVQL